VVLLILAGVFLTVFYATRLWRVAAEIRRNHLRPGATDVGLIQDWMTIPYIARAYKVPEESLWQGLGISPDTNRRKSLHLLDRQYGANQPGFILGKLQKLILEYQSEHPPTPTPQLR
jgi:hypothetical protein